jgi:hypothetical protein
MRCPASAGQQHPTVEGFRAVGHVMSDLHQIIPTDDAPSLHKCYSLLLPQHGLAEPLA